MTKHAVANVLLPPTEAIHVVEIEDSNMMFEVSDYRGDVKAFIAVARGRAGRTVD